MASAASKRSMPDWRREMISEKRLESWGWVGKFFSQASALNDQCRRAAAALLLDIKKHMTLTRADYIPALPVLPAVKFFHRKPYEWSATEIIYSHP